MSGSGPSVGIDATLTERFARATGADALADALGIDYAPYCYVGALLLFDALVLNTYSYLTGGTHAVVRNPFHLAFYAGVALAVVGVRYMHTGHAEAVSTLAERGICEAEHAEEYAPSTRVRLLLYGVVLAGFFGYQTFVIGLGAVINKQGVYGVAFTLVLLPACYLPVAVDFLAEYATLHVSLPRWLAHRNLGLFFFDPQNMGGFRPVGELLKRSYYVYTAGLLLYLAFYYGVWVTPIPGRLANRPGVTEAALFTGLWLFGLATLSYSIYKVHRIMGAEKRERLRDIEAEMQDVIDNPNDIANAEVIDQERLDALEYRLDQVRATSEYPTTFTMWTQIAVSVLLPQVLQLTLQAAV